MTRKVRALAIHLPQFHPIPENDEWWGKGFTEWTNVASAKPLFPGHDQPRIPTDLGFYDLRLPETRSAQAELARNSGFDGFCYYHYWFSGHRLLDRPVQEILATQQPDFPFCLFWANEGWSRRWLFEGEGGSLIDQTYSPEDNVAHARHLAEIFTDPRYIRLGGRPLFIIYRPQHMGEMLPDFVAQLRYHSELAGAGDPYILGSSAWAIRADMRNLGLDGTLDFQPKLHLLSGAHEDHDPDRLTRNRMLGVDSPDVRLYHDFSWRQSMAELRNSLPHPVYPSVMVSWDNTPRRSFRGTVAMTRDPENFRCGLEDALQYLSVRGDELEEPVVFVNAWNEWAEGNYLEPDRTSSSAFLDVCRDLLSARAEDR